MIAGCYYGTQEAYNGLKVYSTWNTDPSRVLTNFATNFGFIYTDMRDIILFAIKDKRTVIRDSDTAGNIFG